jgi:hypothetical protein
MKASSVLRTIGIGAITALLSFSTPAFADDSREMVNQATDLVHQALGDGGDSISNDQRVDLLHQSLKLLGNQTIDFHGHVARAMDFIRAALAKIKRGDPYGTAQDDIRKAYNQLRVAMSIAT